MNNIKHRSFSKILVIITQRIGDVFLATPLIHSLKQAYPQARIDVLVFEGTAGILQGNPDIEQCIEIARRPSKKQYRQLLARIFRRYELSISTLAGDRPIIYALLASAHAISIVPPKRWQDAWKRFLLKAWVELDDEQTHTVIQYLRLSQHLGIKPFFRTVLPQSADSFGKIQLLLRFNLRQQAYVVLHLAPMWTYKRWNIHSWRQLIAFLSDSGYRIVITGGKANSELEYIDKVLGKMAPVVDNLAGKLNFADVALLIQNSVAYIGPDTATTHLAAATGVPTFALFGPTNPQKWAPWPLLDSQQSLDLSRRSLFQRQGSQQYGNVYLIQGSGDCVPCHLEGCDRHLNSHSRCLQELPAAAVIDLLQPLLPK